MNEGKSITLVIFMNTKMELQKNRTVTVEQLNKLSLWEVMLVSKVPVSSDASRVLVVDDGGTS